MCIRDSYIASDSEIIMNAKQKWESHILSETLSSLSEVPLDQRELSMLKGYRTGVPVYGQEQRRDEVKASAVYDFPEGEVAVQIRPTQSQDS